MATFVNGSDIMLFTYTNGAYTSIAHGTSHSLSLSADTEDINTKDLGPFGSTEVNKITWEIQADNMYTNSDYQSLFDDMMKRKSITVVFGLKNEPSDAVIDSTYSYWTPAASYIYSGKAIITSLDWQADAGSKSTFSATLQGQGEIKRGMPNA